MPFSALRRVFIAEHRFRKQSHQAVKQVYQVTFLTLLNQKRRPFSV
jgi:hypothetical protein